LSSSGGHLDDLDGWAVGGLVTNIAIILILALKQQEFQ